MLILSILLAISLSNGGNLGAQQYERRLVPIAAGVAPGAFGSQWVTRATAVQELDMGVEIVGDMSTDWPPGVGNSQPYNVFPLTSENEPPGALMYVPTVAAAAVHISARLQFRIIEGPFEDATVLPVVSEDEFVDHTLYFLQIANDARERVHLRVYSLDLEHPNPRIRVRIQATWAGASWAFVYDQVHRLRAEQKFVTPSFGGAPVPVRPLALQLFLEPIIETLPADARVAVSILPVSDDLRIWGMVSETDNVTQRVRLVLPE